MDFDIIKIANGEMQDGSQELPVNVKNSNGTHHHFPPSSFKKRFKCPLSYKMSRNNKSVQTKENIDGTQAHTAVEERDVNISPVGYEEKVQKTLDLIDSLKDSTSWLNIYNERRIYIKDSNGEVISFGTVDMLVEYENCMYLLDYKFGVFEVDHPQYNHQIKGYALGVFQEFEKPVVAGIWQPFINDQAPVNYSYSNEELLSFQKDLERCWYECNSEFPPMYPSLSNCKFCDGKKECMKNDVSVAKISYFDDNDLSLYSPEDIGEIYEYADFIASRCKDIQKKCMEYARDNNGSMGKYMLSRSNPQERLSDGEQTISYLAKYFSPEEIVKSCSIKASKTDAIDAIARKLKDSGEYKTLKDAKVFVEQEMRSEGIMTYSKGKESVKLAK